MQRFVLALFVALLGAAPAWAQAVPSKCNAAKLKATGAYLQAIFACQAKGVQRAASLDRACIEKAGFSPSLLDEALADPTTETEYKEEHEKIAKEGCFGVASLIIDGSEPVFGPVIIPVPTGEEAGELWDHVAAMSTKGYFFELKRTRH